MNREDTIELLEENEQLKAEVARLNGACRRAINLLRDEGDEGLALSIEAALADVRGELKGEKE
jgi:hypothetical protein